MVPEAEISTGVYVLQKLNPGWAWLSASTSTACRKPSWRTAVRSTASITMLWRTICRTSAGLSFAQPSWCHTSGGAMFWRFTPLPVCSYAAVRCSGAAPMSSLELQQARETHIDPEPEQRKPNMNGDADTVSKPPSKPQKGIMGMFASKAVPKAQESSREPEEASQVPISVIRYSFKGRFRGKVSLIKFIQSVFQVEPAQSKAAGKANPMANFFKVQTSSEETADAC